MERFKPLVYLGVINISSCSTILLDNSYSRLSFLCKGVLAAGHIGTLTMASVTEGVVTMTKV